MRKFYPEDIISLAFSFPVLILQLYFFFVEEIAYSLSDLLTLPLGVFLLLILIFSNKVNKHPFLRFIRIYYHIPLYGIVFTAFQSFIHRLNPNDWDRELHKWDYLIFGFDITVWFEKCVTPWLTEILTLSYFSYYILPTLTFVLLYFGFREKNNLTSRKYLLAIVIGWYFAFIFYALLPAAGPDIAFPGNYSVVLKGVSPFTSYYLETLGKYLRESNVRNTFPSMHFCIILISCYFAYLYKRKYFWFCVLPLGIMLGLATLYLRQHYLVDLIAAFPLAAIFIYTGRKYAKQTV
ncbi:MAG: phosphatase PAP2 family protein [Ignavibacteria bacterium]|nr:phosphatase PAP2 family protein [Ignavibacteria bacterium]